MSWPTQQTLNNVDSAGASLTDARAQVYQNLANINAIIDEFNITNASNGDILVYNSTTNRYEAVDPDTALKGSKMAILNLNTSNGFSIVSDIHNLVTINSDNQGFTFNEDGDYFLEYNGHIVYTAFPATDPGDFLGEGAPIIGANGIKHWGPKFQIFEKAYVEPGYITSGDSTADYVTIVNNELPEYPAIIGYDPGTVSGGGIGYFIRVVRHQ